MKYCLIDVSNLVYRARYGSHKDRPREPRAPGLEGYEEELRESLGLCLHTTFKSLAKVYSKFGAGHVVACFDHRPWRSVIYPRYKRNRVLAEDATPEEIEKASLTRRLITETIESLLTFFHESTNVTVLYQDMCEADDFIARWISSHPSDHHFIMSTDSDYKQLVRENVELYAGVSNELYTSSGVFYQDALKVRPGDAVRNIHGETWRVKLDKKISEPVMIDPAWELFKKVMLGDDSDNVARAAPPKVGEVKLRAHYAAQGGIGWQNLMDTPVGDGTYVRDLYERNVELVDLTRQPDEVKALMDAHISGASQKERRPRVGVAFLQFCKANRLVRLAESAETITPLLSAACP